uniref:Xylulose kinase-1 n=1 Tax=Tanacetum cinerariifolium TaxID=118510 RepID=A0A6L2LPG3_TANCI|nr:hypothetical protein [Tanacetum cinerariifolium]
MTTLKFTDTHNVVAFLSKLTKSDGFEQIVDFLNAHPIRYALIINPIIYISCIEQFWSTAMAKTINGEVQIHARVDGKEIVIIESSVRRDLQLTDKEDEVIHKELGDRLMRAATTVFSIELEQDSGNITKTQSKETPNESSSQGTKSGGGPRIKSSDNEENLGEDASKHERRIDAINVDDEITLVNDADNEMFDVDDLVGEEVFVAEQEVVSTAATTETITTEEITLAQALKALKTSKPKVKGVIFHEPADLKLQVEFDEEERLARERAEKEQEANIALIETWDDIQAKIDADHHLAERLQAQEQEEFAFRRVNTFKDFRIELVKEKEKRARKELIQENEEEVAIDAIPLAVKSPRIVDWKIPKEKRKSMQIYMLVEKKYHLTPPTLSMMSKKKLQIDYESEMAYQLCKLIKKPLKK